MCYPITSAMVFVDFSLWNTWHAKRIATGCLVMMPRYLQNNSLNVKIVSQHRVMIHHHLAPLYLWTELHYTYSNYPVPYCNRTTLYCSMKHLHRFELQQAVGKIHKLKITSCECKPLTRQNCSVVQFELVTFRISKMLKFKNIHHLHYAAQRQATMM